MQPTIADRHQTSQPEVIYLQRIDEALENRTVILEQLQSIRSAPESAGFRTEIDSFIAALHSELPAKDFVKEGAFAAWLPAILQWDPKASLRSQQISQLAVAISRNSDIRWARSNTFVYFQVLFFACFATLLFLSGAVLPVFDTMFKEFQLKLPLLTEIVLDVGMRFSPYAKEIFMISVSSYIMIWLGRRILRRISHDRFFGSYFTFLAKGSSSRIVPMSRWLLTLSSLLKISTPLREAIIISGRASQSEWLVQHAVRLARELKDIPINDCTTAAVFPPIVIDALRDHGLTRGELLSTVELLHELGILYAERAMHRQQVMLRFLLPLFIVVVGGCVALVILALFLPLVSMVTSLAVLAFLVG